MQMYPGYKPRDVLNEYAITFYALLNEGYRKQAEHYKMLAQLAAFDRWEAKDINDFIRELDWASKTTSDILSSSSNKGSTPDQIKKLLGG